MEIDAQSDTTASRSPEILIVEDEAIVALELETRLKRLGYDVRSTATDEEALRCIEERHPDLVLMDIVLAGRMKGTKAAKLINFRFRIPVVYVSAYTDPSTLREIMETEEHGLLTKPFKPEQLQTIVELAIARHLRDKQRSAAERKVLEEGAHEHLQHFTYAAGHDLQEPLRTAVCFVDLLEKRVKSKLDPEESYLLNEARAGLSRMGTLLEDLLSYAQAGVPGGAALTDTTAEAVLDRAIANLKGSIAESGVDVIRRVSGPIVADGPQLTQVLQNLLGNAIKYRKRNGRAQVRVKCCSV